MRNKKPWVIIPRVLFLLAKPLLLRSDHVFRKDIALLFVLLSAIGYEIWVG